MGDSENIWQQKTLTLYYPDIRGIAQPIRNLFYYLNLNFQEISISNYRQLQAGFNSGYPKLVHQDFQLTDTIAIFRHLCRTYQRLDLLGLTPQNRASINQFLFHYSDIRLKLIKKVSEGARNAWGKHNQGQVYQIKLSIIKSFVEDECRLVKDLLQCHMKSKGWLFGYLTIADFFYYELCFYIVNFLGTAIKNNLIYRNFYAFLYIFESQQFFVNNKQKIENKKIFMPFKDKEASEKMLSFWEGVKQLVV